MNGQKNGRIAELLLHAYRCAPGWREWFDRHGIDPREISSEDDLCSVPVLRKSQLTELQRQRPPFAGLYAGEGQPARVFLSPGPIYDPQPNGEDPWRFATALLRVGFSPGDVVLNEFSYHLSPAGFMFDQALRSFRATVLPTGTGNTELLVGMLKDLRASGYVGTPSYLRAIVQRAEEAGLRFGEEIFLAKAFFTAEPIPADFPPWCEERGIRFGEAYGIADAGCIAYRCHPETGLQVEPHVLVQLCDPDSGQPVAGEELGEIVVTVFDPDYPLIRFGTGDLSRWLPGETGRKIAGVLGRTGDGVKVRGMFVYRQQLDQVFKQYPEVGYYLAEVVGGGGKDQLRISLELAASEPGGLLERLAEHLREVLRVKAELCLVQAGTLDRSLPVLRDLRK
jgi:phenylacetate-CoA ligase